MYKPWERSRTQVSSAAFNLQLYWNTTPPRVLSCQCCESSQNSFFTEHLWTAASKLFNIWIYLNIRNILCCYVGMAVYVKYWRGQIWEWNCYSCPRIWAWNFSQSDRTIGCGESNCKERKKKVDWADKTESQICIWNKFVIVSV